MADNRQIAIDVLEKIGGRENVAFVTHCMTRLRFNLVDEAKADDEEVKGVSGVISVVHSGGALGVPGNVRYASGVDRTCDWCYDDKWT